MSNRSKLAGTPTTRFIENYEWNFALTSLTVRRMVIFLPLLLHLRPFTNQSAYKQSLCCSLCQDLTTPKGSGLTLNGDELSNHLKERSQFQKLPCLQLHTLGSSSLVWFLNLCSGSTLACEQQ
eukprot:227291-Amphidinium_carterae.2